MGAKPFCGSARQSAREYGWRSASSPARKSAAGAVSTVLFLVCGVLCVVIMRTMSDDVRKGGRGK